MRSCSARSHVGRIIGILVTAAFLSGCIGDEDNPPATATSASTTQAQTIPENLQLSWPNVPIDAIVADPGGFVGRKVIAHGEVAEIITSNVLVIKDGQESILVVGGDLPTEDLEPGTFVRVNGAVRDFDIPEIEGELGFELQDDRLSEFDDQLSIVASLVTVGVTSVEDLLEHAGVFVGRDVAVIGQVAEISSGGTITLRSDDAEDVLLVIPDASIEPEFVDEAWIRVTGEVGIFDAEVIGDALDVPDSFDDMLFVAAGQIEPVAPAPTATVDAIVDDPDAYVGEDVTIAAEVTAVLTPEIITVAGDGALFGLGRNEIPVLIEGMEIGEFDGGETVVVSGAVAMVNDQGQLPTITSETIALDPEVRDRIADGPVLIAESIVVVEPA